MPLGCLRALFPCVCVCVSLLVLLLVPVVFGVSFLSCLHFPVQLLLLFLSSLLLGELGGWSANQYLGCLLTFVSAGVYSYIKAAGARPPAPPVSASDNKKGPGNA